MSRAADRHRPAAPGSAREEAELVGARLVWVVDPPECPERWPPGSRWRPAADPEVLRLLRAVAAGRVSHGEDNRGGLAVSWLLDGESVGLQLKALARAELVELPFGGPVRLAAQGRRLLALTSGIGDGA